MNQAVQCGGIRAPGRDPSVRSKAGARGLLRRLTMGSSLIIVLFGHGCGEEAVPVLSDLTCTAAVLQDDQWKASLTFAYADADGDLDEQGAVLKWWIKQTLSGDEIPQTDLPLSKQNLSKEGTLVVELAPFWHYELYTLRLVAVDAAGHASNELLAEVDTDPDIGGTCVPVESETPTP